MEDGPDPEFFDELRKKGDTRIVRMLSMWVNGGVDMGSFRIRKAVLDLDPRNYTAEVIATGAVSFVRKPLWITMPPDWWENRCRTQAEIDSDYLGGAKVKVDRLKNLIKTAETDMDSHPAFPQENIKYEAVAIETSKGNIYHAVLELTQDEGDELIEQMKQNDDTHIISFVCMFSDDEHSSGSYDLRKKLRKLHPENGNTVLLWTVFDAYGQHNCRQHKLKELNPLYFSNDLDIFEFHDAKLKLTRYAMNSRYLYLSVNHLNVKKNTEQNPTDSDMEIKEAHVTFSNFYMNYLRTKTRYQPNEKGDFVPIEVSETTLFEDEALHYFFDRLKEKRELTVLELKRSKNGKYFMFLDAEPGRFEMEFTISSAHVTWDEEGWYEQYFRDMRAKGITPKSKEEE